MEQCSIAHNRCILEHNPLTPKWLAGSILIVQEEILFFPTFYLLIVLTLSTITPRQLCSPRDSRMINHAVVRMVSKTRFFPTTVAQKLLHSSSVLETTSRKTIPQPTVVLSMKILGNPKKSSVNPKCVCRSCWWLSPSLHLHTGSSVFVANPTSSSLSFSMLDSLGVTRCTSYYSISFDVCSHNS